MTNEGSLLSVRRIYYRSKLNGCNYTCSYCPFGKKSHPASKMRDKQAWSRFITAIEQWEGETLQLFVIPYGEALIHRYYREGIIQLASLPQVTGISCQTNLSFPADEWLNELRTAPALINKIKVWASFHPEMTSVEKFVRQLHTLHNAGIQVCAGAVGNPLAKNILADLRNTLSPDPLYLATSLSVEQARRKLGKTLFSLFKGGAFADGGLLLYDGRNRCLSVELLPDVNGESAKITAHSYEGQVYKYSMLVYEKEQRENILSRLKAKPYQVFYKPPLITVVHKEAGKKKGVLHICKVLAFPLEQVLIVGNSQKDWEMMSAVPHSCAVMNSEPFLTEHARYTLNPDRLPAFFRFRE